MQSECGCVLVQVLLDERRVVRLVSQLPVRRHDACVEGDIARGELRPREPYGVRDGLTVHLVRTHPTPPFL